MNLKTYYWFILFVSVLINSSEIFAQKKISLDNDWKFHLGNSSNPEKDFDYGSILLFHKSNISEKIVINQNYVDTAWSSISVPHDWAVELPFVKSTTHEMDSHGYKPIGALYPETSIGWYRKHFSVDKIERNNRFEIQFDGIYRNATIWINGFYVGTNFSGYIGKSYDITDFIDYKNDNVIVVRVDATQNEGWFYEGAGIYRHVWLKIMNKIHIPEDGLYVHSTVNGKVAKINIETEIENSNLNSTKATVYSFITDRNGKQISKTSEHEFTISTGEKTNIKQTILLNNVNLWSLENPYLYKITSVVKQKNQIINTKKVNFGVKTVKFDAKNGFSLNGRNIKIKGTNNHQDHAGIGSALPDFMQYYRIKLLKEMGSNAYRTSHHAPAPELLDACDSLGILVLDEQRLLNSSAEYKDQFERLLKRDRNHPSVFLWSIGNEEQNIQANDFGKRIGQSLLAMQQKFDPSRTSTYAADMGNDFNGVNEIIPIRGFNYRQFAVSDYHREHPNQPLLGTEMGSTVTTRGIYEKDSIHAYVPDQDIIAPWWASKAEDWWKLAAENDFWMGGFIWTGFDYRGEPTPYKWPNINSHFGVMDVCGFPKNIYYYYKSWWSTEDILHISPHWNWPEKIGKPIDVWVNSNADDVELFLNEKSLGKKSMPKNSHLQWSVIYEPGKLEAIAHKNNKIISTKVETTGEANQIILTADKVSIQAGGVDGTVINISVVDKDGKEVPTADNMIKFNVSGGAKIIGVGNGDPSSHEADKCLDGFWQRSAFNGKCQVILQGGKNAESIKFEAKANGLVASEINLIVK